MAAARRAHQTGVLRGLAIVALCGSLAGCSANYRNHGYVPLEEDLAKIKVGVDTRESVAAQVGSPASTGVLNESGYYYVRSRVKHFAWQAPEVVDRQVVAISFTPKGTVSNIGRYTLRDGNVVPLTRRITRTGQDIGFIRKLLSNIGKFSPGALLNGS